MFSVCYNAKNIICAVGVESILRLGDSKAFAYILYV